MLKVKQSNPNRPYRFLIYGEEGLGKSTFGAKAEKPIFISAEGGTDQLTDSQGNPVSEIESVKTWSDVKKAAKDLLSFPHDFKTLVIDSLDWIETMAQKEIIGETGKTIITVDGGYNSGFKRAQSMLKEFIQDLELLREQKNMNIIFTAHAQTKEKKDPMQADNYHRYQIKCNELFSEAAIEWCDAMFFVGLETFVKTKDKEKTGKAFGGDRRLMYTTQKPSFRAKNRYSMPESFVFDFNIWESIMPYIKKGYKPVSAQELYDEATQLLALVDDADVRGAAEKFINENKDNVVNLRATVDRLKVLTKGEQ